MYLLILLLACGPHPAPPAPESPASPASAPSAPAPAEALAPRPFNAAALAAGIPAGTMIRLRIESAGDPTVEQRWDFTRCTETEATIRTQVFDAAGALLKDEGEGAASWAELEGHASFPAASTQRTEEVYDGAMGRMDVWLYTATTPGDDGVPLVKRFRFSKLLPGPPVLFTMERGGVEVFRMTMIERTQPAG